MVPELDNKWEQSDVLRELAEDLAESGYKQTDAIFTTAIIAAQNIDAPNMKRDALDELATSLARIGRYAEAQTLAQTIEDGDMRLRTLRRVASISGDKKQYAEALAALGARQPDNWIGVLTCGASSADEIDPALVSTGLCEVVRILGWISPDYHAVYEQLVAAED